MSITSCSDDSGTGSDSLNCNTISLPTQLTPVQVNNEYFNNQNVPTTDEYVNYQRVKQAAVSGNALLSVGGGLGVATTFITAVQFLGIQPSAGDGTCIWEFDASQFDPEATETIVTVIASKSGDRTLWEVNISGDIGDETVDNFTYVTGFTSDSGNNGEWIAYDPNNSGVEAFVYTWNIESDEVYQLRLDFEDVGEGFVTYERDGVESNTMSILTDNEGASVFWNESNDSG